MDSNNNYENLQDLPENVLFAIVKKFDLDQIKDICSVNNILNERLCNNDIFWQYKYLHDFGEPREIPENWKKAYKLVVQPTHVWVQGQVRTEVFGEKLDDSLGSAGRFKRITEPTLLPYIKNVIKTASNSKDILFLKKDGTVFLLGERKSKEVKIISDNVFVDIAGNESGFYLVSENGKVFSIERNSWGEISDKILGEPNRRILLDRMGETIKFSDIISVSMANDHSLFLDRNGNVRSLGDNHYGESGLKISDDQISDLNNIIAISAGMNYSLALDEYGHVWSFGSNRYGQLGLDNLEKTSTPTMIKELENIVSISAGQYHSLVLDSNGQVWGFGSGKQGALGTEFVKEKSVKPSPIMGLENIKAVYSGYNPVSIVIDMKGDVWGFGGDFMMAGPLKFSKGNFVKLPNLQNVFFVESRSSGLLAIGKVELTSFSVVEKLLEENRIVIVNVEDDLKALTSEPNIVMSFIDSDGKEYKSIVYYDKDKNQIYRKFLTFPEITRMLNSGMFVKFEITPEFQNPNLNPNVIMTFITSEGESYNAVVHYDKNNNQIKNPI